MIDVSQHVHLHLDPAAQFCFLSIAAWVVSRIIREWQQ